MMKRLLILLCLWLSAPALQADDTRITVIDLKGRTAEEMIPLVHPMLDPGGAISGTGYQLIVRTTPANLAEIQDMIAHLDHSPRRLLIQVHRGELDIRRMDEAGAHVDQRTGNVRIQAGDRGQDGLALEHSSDDGSAGAHIRSTRTLRDADNRQQVQTLEGQPAYIDSGVAFPVVRQTGPYGTGIDYRQAGTGFYVKAQLRGGDQVYLEIAPHRETLSREGGGMVDTSSLATTLSGPLDTWLELGGTGEYSGESGGEVARSHRTRRQDNERIWLRVEVLD